ncbi:hypothetical protein HPB49_000797 [Dermacentor silvarum]|uniref:Uncharacterized protein n=1 Tax=Dermacentor silvarum TaxID=543639 RepID=A0ACB8CIR6_DERSI|nr:hypothetical protein HPB49_000797 [Dermacentor silvarum]
MALVPGDDPDSMREMELSTAETPVFDKTTEYTIQKKLEQWERATSRRASCEQQRSPSHGGGSDGDATASALGKQAQSKRWKPQVMPRFGAEEAVIIIKPKGTLNLAQFRGSNQIGEAMYAAASIPRASQALAIWPAWDQNIIIIGIKNAQLIRQVLAIGQLELGGQARAVQAYLKTSDNTSRGVIQVDPKATEADITQAIYSPEAPVVGVRKLGKTNVAAITFEGRKVPFNVYYWGEAVPVRLYRKTTPACPRCGTIGHRPDVCPNPQTGRCRACGETNLQEDHECQPSCLICGGPHLTGSIQCNQKYRRGGAGTGAGRKPVNGKASQQHQSKKSVTSQAPDLQARTPGETPSPRPHGRAFSGGPGGGGRPADKHDGPEPDPRRGNKTSSNKVSWADVVASPPLTLADEKLRAENERLRLEIQKLREKTAANAPENCIASQVPSAQAMEEDNPPPPPSGSATKLPSGTSEIGRGASGGGVALAAVPSIAECTAHRDADAITQKFSEWMENMEKRMQEEIAKMESRMLPSLQASVERIEETLSKKIEQNLQGMAERTIHTMLEPHLSKLQAYEIRIDRKLQEFAECSRTKTPRLTGKMGTRQIACDDTLDLSTEKHGLTSSSLQHGSSN